MEDVGARRDFGYDPAIGAVLAKVCPRDIGQDAA
jgi:hypothetical protein